MSLPGSGGPYGSARRGRRAQAANPDLAPPTRLVSRRVLAEAEQLRGAAERAFSAPSAARGSTGA